MLRPISIGAVSVSVSIMLPAIIKTFETKPRATR